MPLEFVLSSVILLTARKSAFVRLLDRVDETVPRKHISLDKLLVASLMSAKELRLTVAILMLISRLITTVTYFAARELAFVSLINVCELMQIKLIFLIELFIAVRHRASEWKLIMNFHMLPEFAWSRILLRAARIFARVRLYTRVHFLVQLEAI